MALGFPNSSVSELVTRILFSVFSRVLGILLIATLAALGFGAWYLANNPIDLTYLKPRIEKEIEQVLPAYDIELGETILTFDYEEQSALIVAKDLLIKAKNGSSQARVPIVDLRLSTQALLRGVARPRDIAIQAETLEFRRLAEDRVGLVLVPKADDDSLQIEFPLAQATAPFPKGQGELATSSPQSRPRQDQIIRDLLTSFDTFRRNTPFMSQLRTIDIKLGSFGSADVMSNARFAARDFHVALDLRRQNAKLDLQAGAFSASFPTLRNQIGGFSPRVAIEIDQSQAVAKMHGRLAVGSQLIDVDLDLNVPAQNDIHVKATLSSFRPSGIAGLHPLLGTLSEINVPIKGTIDARLSADLQPIALDFDLDGGQGEFTFPPFYNSLIFVDGGTAKGRYDVAQKQLTITEASYTYPLAGGSTGLASGDFYFDFDALDDLAIEQRFNLTATALDSADLMKLWPACARTPCLKTWFEEAEIAGRILNARFSQHEFVAKNPRTRNRTLSRNGSFEFSGAQMRPWAYLPLATNASGTMTFGLEESTISLNPGGKAGVSDWGAAQIRLVHKDQQPLIIEGQASATSPLSPLLATLATGRVGLDFLTELPINDMQGQVGGEVAITLMMPPQGQPMTADRVAFQAKGSASNLGWAKMLMNTDVHSGNIDFEISPQIMTGAGKGYFGEAPIDVSFKRSFDPASQTRTEVEFLSDMLVGQALSYAPFLSGYLPGGSLALQGTYFDDWAGDGLMSTRIDMANAELQLPFLALSKPRTHPGGVELVAELKGGIPVNIPQLRLATFRPGETNPFFAVEGSGRFSEQDGAWEALSFNELKFEDTVLRGLTLLNLPQAMTINVQGGQFNARAIFAALERVEPANGASATEVTQGKPIIFEVDMLDRVLLPSGEIISNVSFSGQRVGTLWHSLEVRGRLPFSSVPGLPPQQTLVSFGPLNTGGYELFMETGDAGALLKTLGYWQDMGGGVMRFRGTTPQPLLAAPLIGEVAATGFYINNAPMVTDLLNLISLQGLLDLANGQGLWMDGMVAKLRFDRGLLDLRDVEVAGPSIGISLNGQIDMQGRQVSIGGALAPFNFISQAVGNIPLIGEILTGTKGEGFLAADFSLIGGFDDIIVNVNPLTALAPGILREMFNDLSGNISPFERRSGSESIGNPQ